MIFTVYTGGGNAVPCYIKVGYICGMMGLLHADTKDALM